MRLSALFIALCIVATGLGATVHTHRLDTKAPEQCNFCQVTRELRSGAIPVLQKAEPARFRAIALLPDSFVFVDSLVSAVKLSRAPPSV